LTPAGEPQSCRIYSIKAEWLYAYLTSLQVLIAMIAGAIFQVRWDLTSMAA
jgi:hypothetical protein